MNAVAAHDLTRSYNCKIEGCTDLAGANRGTYAYLCKKHADEKRRTLTLVGRPRSNGAPPGSYEAAAKSIVTLAKRADQAKAKMRPALERARAAKEEADEAHREFLVAVRALLETR
jgi:hypothetical protein